jgi:hypothetical protein
MVLEITCVCRKSGQSQFADAAAETLADPLSDFSIAGPAKPEPRQALLQEFSTFGALQQISFSWFAFRSYTAPGFPMHENR